MRRMVVVACACSAIVFAACDWRMVGYEPGQSGWNRIESRIGVDNADALAEAWTASLPGTTSNNQPVLAGGVTYVPSDDGYVYVYDADGGTACGGVPKQCEPLWRAATGAPVLDTPAVVNGFLYAGSGNRLSVFDAAGETTCSGSPRTCTPLWTATGLNAARAPVVAGGRVYENFSGQLAVFDASGSTACGGSPKTCAPLWTANVPGARVPAVAAGTVYLTVDTGLAEAAAFAAYDAKGTTNCSGTPRTCEPLWLGLGGCQAPDQVISCSMSDPVAAGGRVYLSTLAVDIFDHITRQPDYWVEGFDAAGAAGCQTEASGLRLCSQIWRGRVDALLKPAVDSDHVYVGGTASDVTTANRVWTGQQGGLAVPAIANGVVYVVDDSGNFPDSPARLLLYDASGTTGGAGSTGCTGTPPSCFPLRIITLPPHAFADDFQPVIVNGFVYLVVAGVLHAYTVP